MIDERLDDHTNGLSNTICRDRFAPLKWFPNCKHYFFLFILIRPIIPHQQVLRGAKGAKRGTIAVGKSHERIKIQTDWRQRNLFGTGFVSKKFTFLVSVSWNPATEKFPKNANFQSSKASQCYRPVSYSHPLYRMRAWYASLRLFNLLDIDVFVNEIHSKMKCNISLDEYPDDDVTSWG